MKVTVVRNKVGLMRLDTLFMSSTLVYSPVSMYAFLGFSQLVVMCPAHNLSLNIIIIRFSGAMHHRHHIGSK